MVNLATHVQWASLDFLLKKVLQEKKYKQKTKLIFLKISSLINY